MITRIIQTVLLVISLFLVGSWAFAKCKNTPEQKKMPPPPAATTTQPAPNPKTNTAQMELVCELELPEIYAFSVDATSSYFVESYGVPVWIHFPGMDPLYFDGKTNYDGSAKSASKKEATKRKAGTATICAATEKDKRNVIPVKIYKLRR